LSHRKRLRQCIQRRGRQGCVLSGRIDNDSPISGQDFHGKAAELHFVQNNLAGSKNDFTLVEGDLDGDKSADFQIELAGLHTLAKSDFIL
jgi:hypothetical protein